MDPMNLVASLPSDVVDAITAFRMYAIQYEHDSSAYHGSNSTFVVRTFGARAVEELQAQALRSDAEYTLALLNLIRVASQHSDTVDEILGQWRNGHPNVFR